MTDTSWLRTKEGFVRLPVLRPFTFNRPAATIRPDTLLIQAKERRFEMGEHLLDPENEDDAAVLAHSWINKHFADGHIERPDVTRAREIAEAERSAKQDAERKRLREEAENALRREEIAAEGTRASGDDMQDELNTPINQPRSRRGGRGKPAQDIDPAALDTPLNQLPRG